MLNSPSAFQPPAQLRGLSAVRPRSANHLPSPAIILTSVGPVRLRKKYAPHGPRAQEFADVSAARLPLAVPRAPGALRPGVSALVSYIPARLDSRGRALKRCFRGDVPRPQRSPVDSGASCSRAAPVAELQPVAARRAAGNLAASERAMRRRPGRTRPPEVLCVLVAHKSCNPGGRAPGASDYFSRLSEPAGPRLACYPKQPSAIPHAPRSS
jgi:hypothetical protein